MLIEPLIKRYRGAARRCRKWLRACLWTRRRHRNLRVRPRPGPFTIVWSAQNAGPCSQCQNDVGSGPVGWRERLGPLCDQCLIDRCWGLGSALLAVNVTRELVDDDERGADRDEVLIALMTYLRLYHRSASERWPHRPVGFIEQLRDLGARFAQRWPSAADALRGRNGGGDRRGDA